MTGMVTAGVLAARRTRSARRRRPAFGSLSGLGVGGRRRIWGGTRLKHRSRVVRDPNQPNLRQVHLIHAEAV